MAKTKRRISMPGVPCHSQQDGLPRAPLTLKLRVQMFGRCLGYVCMGLMSCGWAALSQPKTENGFYFPTAFRSSRSQAVHEGLRGFLSGCTANSGDFHVGTDLRADVGAPVYAVSGGFVAAKSIQTLSPETSELLIRHRPSGGTEFYAVYGNIRTSLEVGMSVSPGQSIGTVGHSRHTSHLHFAVIMTDEDVTLRPADWDLLPCSRWPDRVRYVDPLEWLGPLEMVADSAFTRCDLNLDGVVDAKDVELGRLMAVKAIPCTADLNNDGKCDVVDVQRIVNASLAGICRLGR